jgi:hypothetical protein
MLVRKKCAKCKRIKLNDAFYKSNTNKSGLRSYCIDCGKNNAKHWRTSLPLEKRKKMEREDHLRNKYNITPLNYDTMLKIQKYKCAICFKKYSNKNKLEIDHCHKTGNIRGLLCKSCNIGLGIFKDSLEGAQKIIIYLENKENKYGSF